MHEQFGVHWDEPVLFDLVLNTDRLSVETCVQQIKTCWRGPSSPRPKQSRALLQGMALSARVRAALSANEATDGVDVTIDCLDGKTTLRGIVADNHEKAATVQVSAGVPV